MTGGIWDVLGIAPTTDAILIRKAYATRMKAMKRDLDPHAFQELREAYEAALAETEDAPVAPTPVAHSIGPLTQHAGSAPSQRVHWRDFADAPSDPPDGEERRRGRDSQQERERIEAVLASIGDALSHGSEKEARARLAEGHDALSHPLDGVSLAALAGFERALLKLIQRVQGEGRQVVAFAYEAAHRFHWSERVRNVRVDSDPLAHALRGYAIAEEIFQCARGAGAYPSPVSWEFAQDLTDPVRFWSVAQRLGRRASTVERQEQLRHLDEMPNDPVAWLPTANVALWRRALDGPRFYWVETFAVLAIACIVLMPYGAVMTGRTIEPAFELTMTILMPAMLAFPALFLLQDYPAFAWVRWVGGRIDAIRSFFARSRKLPGTTVTVRALTLYPLAIGLFMAGFWESLKRAENIKVPLDLVHDTLGWWALIYGVLGLWHGFMSAMRMGLGARLVPVAKAVGWVIAELQQRSRVVLGIGVVVLGMVMVVTWIAFVAMQNGTSPKVAFHNALATAALMATFGLVGGAMIGIPRMPPAWQAWAWGALCIIGLPLILTSFGLSGEDSSHALGMGLSMAMDIAKYVIPVVVVTQLPRIYRAMRFLFDRWDEGPVKRWFPRAYSAGASVRHVLQAIGVAAVATVLAALVEPGLERGYVILAGAISSIVATGFLVLRAPRRK